MIALSGGSGNGTLTGVVNLANRGYTAKGYAIKSWLDEMSPPIDWKLPPPDGVWYPVDKSPYGPFFHKVDVGFLESERSNGKDWHPCQHFTLRGTGHYRGPNEENALRWTMPASSPKSVFTHAEMILNTPQPTGRFLVTLKGRPTVNGGSRLTYGHTGTKVTNRCSASGTEAYYWFYDTTLPATYAPRDVQTSLAQVGGLYRPGDWYVLGYNNSLCVDPIYMTHWVKTDWTRPNRTTVVRRTVFEYHANQSYTPAAFRGESNHGYLVEQIIRTTSYKFTYIQSPSPGVFYVKYNQVAVSEWKGYAHPSYYSGSKIEYFNNQSANIIIPEPGLTASPSLSLLKANKYCAQAAERAVLLYDHRDAHAARAAAVRDVQELDSNWLENLAGVKGTLDVIKPLLEGWSAVKNRDLKAARKALADAYLVYMYVIRPTISDVKNLKEDGSKILTSATTNRFSQERRRGRVVKDFVPVVDTLATISYFTTYHLKLKDNAFSTIWSALEKLGLDPSSGQIWDLVPFSFVIDWFISIGDALKLMDQYNSLVLYRDILARIESFKVQWPVGDDEFLKNLFDGLVCSTGSPIEYSLYLRRVYQDAGEINPLSVLPNDGLTLSQMTQGTALLTQMMR